MRQVGKECYCSDKQIEKMGIVLATIHKELMAKDRLLEREDLYTGRLGTVLFSYYYSRSLGEIPTESIDLLDKVVTHIGEMSIEREDQLCLFSHLGQVIRILAAEDYTSFGPYEELLEAIDGLLLPYMKEWLANHNFDLFSGATQIAMYYSLRKRMDYLSFYIDCLYSNKEIYIRSEPDRAVNFTLAHGIPGILLFLMQILPDIQDATSKIEKICSSWVYYLMEMNKSVPNSLSYFRFDSNDLCYRTRLAWCQGDLSNSYVLYKIANHFPACVPEKIVESISQRTLYRFNREVEWETCLCHGLAGVALLYQSLYQLTAQNCYLSATRKAVDKLLDLVRIPTPIPAYTSGLEKEIPLGEGLLLGHTGVGLGLMALMASNEPKWLKLILL